MALRLKLCSAMLQQFVGKEDMRWALCTQHVNILNKLQAMATGWMPILVGGALRLKVDSGLGLTPGRSTLTAAEH